MPRICPEYIGLLWRFSRMSPWTRSFVHVSQQSACLPGSASVRHQNGGGGGGARLRRPARAARRRRLVASLRLAAAGVNGVAVHARRRARLEAAELQAEPRESAREAP